MPNVSRIFTPTFPKLFFSGTFVGSTVACGILPIENTETFDHSMDQRNVVPLLSDQVGITNASSKASKIGTSCFLLSSILQKPRTALAAPIKNLSLEEEFFELATKPIDISAPIEHMGEHYLIPNENPAGAQRHFHPEDGGIHLCTGAERLFSNAGMTPQRDGFIGIDLEPQVIAYNHFNTLLLKISKTRDDYLSLAKPILSSKERAEFLQRLFISLLQGKEESHKQYLEKEFGKYLKGSVLCRYEQQEDRLGIIRARINESTLSQVWKDYYLYHLKSFASIYYPAKQSFFLNPGSPRYGKYHMDAQVFEKIQKYAKEGRLVFLQREINALQFLPQSRVREIDVSNIPDYCVIGPLFQDSKQARASKTRIIWSQVIPSGRQTPFFSWQYDPLLISQNERKEIDDLISHVRKHAPVYDCLALTTSQWIQLGNPSKLPGEKRLQDPICTYSPDRNGENQHPICSYTPETLEILRKCPEELYR